MNIQLLCCLRSVPPFMQNTLFTYLLYLHYLMIPYVVVNFLFVKYWSRRVSLLDGVPHPCDLYKYDIFVPEKSIYSLKDE